MQPFELFSHPKNKTYNKTLFAVLDYEVYYTFYSYYKKCPPQNYHHEHIYINDNFLKTIPYFL